MPVHLTTWENYRRQAQAAQVSMEATLAAFKLRHEEQGMIVTTFQDEVISTPGPARIAYDKMYLNFNLAGFIMFRRGFEAAAQVALDAKLPEHFEYGPDAMEQLNFGKELAALAILGKRV